MASHDEIAIKVSNVSKAFKLPHEKQNSLKSLFVNILKGKRSYEKQQVLDDVSFEVKKGEFFGIVGRNGGGKSTLLKLLAGIYTPDKGNVWVNGKLTPFIELGVGFNMELTGRENVYLNGALLGFDRNEMDSLYNEIVEFAELERFMDQKLKNYSSGMQVRLAFSIAIKAQGDILILDEVLAVGDEAFQRKCSDFFQKVKEDKTKTVVLVTHSMESVRKYCDRAMLVSDGKIDISGSPEDIANEYTMKNFEQLKKDTSPGEYGDGLSERVPMLRIVPVSKPVLTNKDQLIVDIEYKIIDDTPLVVHIGITDEMRNVVILNNGTRVVGKGEHKLRYTMPVNPYNDCNLHIYAVIDEEHTKKRIAFTNESNSYRCLIRNKTGNYGLIGLSNTIHGEWENTKDFIYNRNDDIHST